MDHRETIASVGSDDPSSPMIRKRSKRKTAKRSVSSNTSSTYLSSDSESETPRVPPYYLEYSDDDDDDDDDIHQLIHSVSRQWRLSTYQTIASTSTAQETNLLHELQQDSSSTSSSSDFQPQITRRLTLESSRGNKGALFTGTLDEQLNGYGTLRFDNADIYVGSLRNGKLDGYGRYEFGNARKPPLIGKFSSNSYVPSSGPS